MTRHLPRSARVIRVIGWRAKRQIEARRAAAEMHACICPEDRAVVVLRTEEDAPRRAGER
jgi:hypothetical protein